MVNLGFITAFIELILEIVNQLGYLGILIGMTIESSFFPFPSEAILIPVGVLVAKGQMSFFMVFVAGLAGSILGAWINYTLALFLGRSVIDSLVEKYGKFLFLTKENLKKTDSYFKEHGSITVFVGRLVFVVRQLISIPAGFARMNFLKFTFYTALGASIWTFFLIALGYFFGSELNIIPKLMGLVLLIFVLVFSLIYYNIKVKNRRY